MQPKSQKFTKSDRLKSLKEIGRLFESGESFLVYPLRIVFQSTQKETPEGIKATFSVSKKIFKKAVVRNLIRRQLRESYRKTVHLTDGNWHERSVNCMFIYIAKELLPYATTARAMESAVKKLGKKSLSSDISK